MSMDPVLSCAQEKFGVSYLFPLQRLVIANILDPLKEEESQHRVAEEDEKDFCRKQLVILPTGAGKSLCFQIPPFFYAGITVVVYPLISLMNDQLRRMKTVGLTPLVLRGGMSKQDIAQLQEDLRQKERIILLTNPEALQASVVKDDLKELSIDHFVIDEAHCIVQWGETFRPSYLLLHDIVQHCAPKMVTAFTATASSSIIDGIQEHLFHGELMHVLTGNPDRPNIQYAVLPCLHGGISLLTLFLQCIHLHQGGEHTEGAISEDIHPSAMDAKTGHGLHWCKRYALPSIELPCIVFCSTRRQAEQCALSIRDTVGYDAVRYYHAGLTKRDKEAIESWFFSSDTGILCATSAYGMGVDKANIRSVIHMGPSSSPEAYLQEAGRAGRDGKQALAILLWEITDLALVADAQNLWKFSIGAKQKPSQGTLSVGREPDPFFYSYTTEQICRRKRFLEYLGSPYEYCTGCDRCNTETYTVVGIDLLYYTTMLQNYTLEQLVGHFLGNDPQDASLYSWGSFKGFPEKMVKALIQRAQALRCIHKRRWFSKHGLSWSHRTIF